MQTNPKKEKKRAKLYGLALLVLVVIIGKYSWDARTGIAHALGDTPTEQAEQSTASHTPNQNDAAESSTEAGDEAEASNSGAASASDNAAADGKGADAGASDQAGGTNNLQQTDNAVAQPAARPPSASIEVPVIAQMPELYNGCEVTSLSMLLQSAGKSVSKVELAKNVRKDPTPETQDAQGRTVQWGNPNTGFVGDVTGAGRGYSVYHGPIADLLDQYLPGRAVDLTGQNFDSLLDTLAKGKPVVVWVTENFAPTNAWVAWNSPTGSVRATFDEHCVLLVGYDANTVTINDPLDGTNKQVNRASFEQAWEQLGQQAVTYL